MNDLTGMRRFATGGRNNVRGLTGAAGGAAHRGGQLVQGGGGFFQRGGLLLGAARQVVGGPGDLLGVGADLGGRVEIEDDIGNLLTEIVFIDAFDVKIAARRS